MQLSTTYFFLHNHHLGFHDTKTCNALASCIKEKRQKVIWYIFLRLYTYNQGNTVSSKQAVVVVATVLQLQCQKLAACVRSELICTEMCCV